MSYWSKQRVLVTGGAGFIGSHLVHALVQTGARIKVVDNLARGRLANLSTVMDKIEFVKADLTEAEVCRAACAGQNAIFHLASKVGGIGYYMDRPSEVYTNNILMDTQVVIAARSAGVERFLFSSSAHVYPRHLQTHEDSPALKETDAYPADPVISYGWAKLVTEKLLQYQAQEGHPMRTAIVRIVGAFGENQDIGLDTASAIPAFCRRAIEFPKKSPFTMQGQGRETRSYCYVGDVVSGMIACVETLSTQNHVGPLNLGNEGRVTIGELARLVIEVSGKPIEIKHIEAKESGIRGQAVDCTLTQQTLKDWKPKISLREGIARTYREIEQRLAHAEA